MSINKINPAEKLQTVHLILEGKETQRHARARLGVSLDALQQWIRIYKSEGEGAFLVTRYKQYSKELKEQAVMDYLSGRGSLQEICQRYGIRAKSKLQNWIKKYNGHEELKASGTGGTAIMTKGRKTTFNERVEIVQYCIAHDHNYAETAAKFGVSYQQALQDRRGRSKPVEEMSELERLRAENKILRAEKERAKMEVSFLKKLDELERRRG